MKLPARGTLLLLLLLLLACARNADSACEFRCNSGQCVSIWDRCNSSGDCMDGSDELPELCNTPNTTLAVGDVLTARVEVRDGGNYPMFLLCGDDGQCTRLVVTRSASAAPGALAYWEKLGCNYEGNNCRSSPHSDSAYEDLPLGESVFVVEHRGSALAVWLQGHPDKPVTAAAAEGQTRLRVRPWRWSADMPVHFNRQSDARKACGRYEFRCKSGQCISIWEKCNGAAGDCRDGSDEAPELCSAPNTTLAVGDVLTARVEVRDGGNYPMFLLCGDDGQCTRLVVTRSASAAPGALAYWEKLGCNREGERCHSAPHSDAQYSSLPYGESVFVVEHRGSALAVWLQGHPDKSATAAAAEGQTRLRVRPWMWSADMPAQLSRSVPGKCDGFHCAVGGGCVEACDGRAECPDGADEAPKHCHVLGIKMPVNTEIDAEVTYNHTIHKQLKFILCDSSSCSAIVIHGVSPKGELAYDALVDCSSMGSYCATHLKVQPDSPVAWPASYMHFRMIRRDDRWTLWLPRFPENAIKVPAKASYYRVQARGSSAQPVIPAIFLGLDERRFASTAPQCGWAPKSPAALTVHGDKVPLGAFPWHGGLYRKSGRGAYDYVCGANLITPSVLVTAAHCLYVRDKLQPAGKFAVALGKLYSAWDREDGSGVIKSDVQRVIPHPLYRGVARKYSADIALLQLSRPAELGDTIFPICLGNSHDKAGKVQVVGWGDDQAALEELQSVSLSVRDFGDCVGSFSGSAHELPFITEDKLCSSRDKGLERPPGLAKGDSGSGAVQPFHGQWHLMGLVSVSLDNGKFYGFTDVRRYWGWIHQTYRDITPEFNGTLLI